MRWACEFRPHVKTSKCLPVVQRAARGRRARHHGVDAEGGRAVLRGRHHRHPVRRGHGAGKLPQALALRAPGLRAQDRRPTASQRAAGDRRLRQAQHGRRSRCWIEIDTDGHRSGIPPEATGAARGRAGAARARHAPRRRDDPRRGQLRMRRRPRRCGSIAEQERAARVRAAERLRDAGLRLPGGQRRLDAHGAVGASSWTA